MTNTPAPSLTAADAKAELALVKRELNAALLSPQADTTELRARMLQAQMAFDEAAAAEKAAAATKAAATEAAERAASQAAQDKAVAAVVDTIDLINVAPDLVPLPVPAPDAPVHPAVAAAAANLQAAQATVQRALEAAAPAEAEVARLMGLIAGREAVQAEIRSRRQAGELRATDAAEAHLAAQDAADLRSMLAEAEAQVSALRPSPADTHRVDLARDTLARAQSRAVLDEQLAHVRRLEKAFVSAVRQLGVTSIQHGIANFSTYYAPSDDVRRIGYGGRI